MEMSFNDFLLNVSKPSRYIGCEVNSIKKDENDIEISMTLAFPDVYEVGMSHQGLKILYDILNKHSKIGKRYYKIIRRLIRV